jgi:hypothetical protein
MASIGASNSSGEPNIRVYFKRLENSSKLEHAADLYLEQEEEEHRISEPSPDLGSILDQAKYFLRKEMKYGDKK